MDNKDLMIEPEPCETARLHILVAGRVQGVGFRSFAQQSGVLLGLTGWVRNVGYDSVEMVAEGSREALVEFAEVVKKGPPAGRVAETRVDWETAGREFTNFNVKPSV